MAGQGVLGQSSVVGALSKEKGLVRWLPWDTWPTWEECSREDVTGQGTGVELRLWPWVQFQPGHFLLVGLH